MKKINKSFKVRIYPTKGQKELFYQSFRTSNFIYNYFLSMQEETTEILKFYGLNDKESLSEWRKTPKLYFNKYEASKKITRLKNIEK